MQETFLSAAVAHCGSGWVVRAATALKQVLKSETVAFQLQPPSAGGVKGKSERKMQIWKAKVRLLGL
jgi:hypothetical protein